MHPIEEEKGQAPAIRTLTASPQGHTLHHSHIFSMDDQWIVFDGRNEDTKIGETSSIGVVSLQSGEENVIYSTQNQGIYGPGVGAVSFSPKDNRVIFIHGLYEADSVKPYATGRRFGVGVDLEKPLEGFHFDARDITVPYTPGSLRGGTHSHGWSGNGALISFTYNDEFVEPDLRMVGVMLPSEKLVRVDERAGNTSGSWYSAIVSQVTGNPEWGSDDISKAFDECWLGQSNTLAFQGNTKNESGETITEIYLVKIDAEAILADTSAIGALGERPQVPKGIQQRRLSRTEKGLSELRHWLRSSADGKYIYAIATDEQGRNQLIQCSTSTGVIDYLSDFDFSISSPINSSYKGDQLTFVADNNVYRFDVQTREMEKLTHTREEEGKITGAPVFARNGAFIAFNQYVEIAGKEWLQIKLITL